MIELATHIGWVFIFILYYMIYKYKRSRNKDLFFKQGGYRAFIASSAILVIGGILVYLIIPENPVDLSFLKLHSDYVLLKLKEVKGPVKYFYQNLSILSEMNLLGLLCAVLITAIWMFYVRSLDFFDRERMLFTILCFVLAIFFTFLTFPLSDFVKGIFSIKSSGNTFYNLFVYCFIGIGMVEETIKLLSVLIILFFTNEIDEPIDLIYYACVSALGFAFIENLLYFREVEGSIVIGRALTSAMGHMVDSSVVVYGIILYMFKEGRRKPLLILQYFLLGSFFHALYDYFLFERLFLFLLASFAIFIIVWAVLINNAMNNSKFFDYSISFKHDLVKVKLTVFFSLLTLFTFFLNGLLQGRALAFESYMLSLWNATLLLVFYASSISSFDLFQGYWRPIKFKFQRPNKRSLPMSKGGSIFTSIYNDNFIFPINHVGKNIRLHCPRYNDKLKSVFRKSDGRISDRILLKGEFGDDPDWFLVELEEPLSIGHEYNATRILIRLKNKISSLVHDRNIRCYAKLIPREVDPKETQESSIFRYIGIIIINGEDFEYNFKK